MFIAAYEGIVELAEVIKTRNIETLDLRMNPIGCDGAAAVFGNIYLINSSTNYLKRLVFRHNFKRDTSTRVMQSLLKKFT